MELSHISSDILQKLFLRYRGNLEIVEEQIAFAGGSSQARIELINLRNKTQEDLQSIAQALSNQGATFPSEEQVYKDVLIEVFDNDRGMPRYKDRLRLERECNQLRIQADRAIILEKEVRRELAREAFASVERDALVGLVYLIIDPGYAATKVRESAPLLLGRAIRLDPEWTAQAFLSYIDSASSSDVMPLGHLLMYSNNVSQYSDDSHYFFQFVQSLGDELTKLLQEQ